MSTRYSKERISRGLLHFLLGKGVTSLFGFLAIVLVVRQLSIQDFATYTVLIALVEVVTAITGLGIAHALLRYVPELYARYFQSALRQSVALAILLRSGILLVVVVIAWTWADLTSIPLGLTHATEALRWFLIVVFLRTTNHFLSMVLESTLHQNWVQLAFFISATLRLAGMAVLVWQGETSILAVIIVEAIADGVALCVFIAGLARVLAKVPGQGGKPGVDARWLADNLRSIARFSASAYVQHLAILPYGGNMNRIAGGHLLRPDALAGFGFSQTLYDYMKRYLPAQLLLGFIRPIMVSRYAVSGDFNSASRLATLVLNLNVLSLALIAVPLLIAGEEILLALSGGKYGIEALWLLLALMVVLVLETQRQQLELLSQTVEHYEILIVGNLILSVSIVPGVFLVPHIGAIGFMLANLLGLSIANSLVTRSLRRLGFPHREDWGAALQTMMIATSVACLGLLLKHAGAPWYLAVGFSLMLHAVLSLHFQWALLLDFVDALISGITTNRSLPVLGEAPEPDEPAKAPVVAFGVLSSRVESAETIRELARLVAPHPVIVHHDFTKCPTFELRAPNVEVLTDHAITAWGDWSLVEATNRLMARAFSRTDVTHFQLLSESCLPVKPVTQFQEMLASRRPAAMVEGIAVDSREVFASHGWRYVSPNPTVMKIAKKVCYLYIGQRKGHRQVGNINISLATAVPITHVITRWFLGYFIDLLQKGTARRMARLGIKSLTVGSQWFGVNRHIGMWLLRCQSACPELVAFFSRTHIPDEAFFHSLLFNCPGLQRHALAESNHFLTWRTNQNGPDILTEKDIGLIHASGRYFARKFPLDPASPIRKQITRITEQHT